MPKNNARRAAVSKELVPVGDPLWDNQIRDTLEQVIYFNRSQSGRLPAPEVRRMMAIHAESRLQNLVAQLEERLGYVPQ